MKTFTAFMTVLLVGICCASVDAQEITTDLPEGVSQEDVNKALEDAMDDVGNADYEKAGIVDPLRKAFEKRAAKLLKDGKYEEHAKAYVAYVDALAELTTKTEDMSARTALIDAQLDRASFLARDYPEEHRDEAKAKAALDAAEAKLDGLTDYLRGTYADRIADVRRSLFSGEAGPAPSGPTIDTGADDGGPKEIILN